MNKEDILKILEGAKDKNGDVPIRIVRQAFEKLSEPCTDTISRQAAIDILSLGKEILSRVLDNIDVVGREKREKYSWGIRLIESSINDIEELPSAQPEQRWIPVSERMPEDGENCLVSVRCSNNFLVDRGTYSTDLFNVDEEDFFGNRGESGWYYLSSEYGYCKILNVIAWMPEPRPYKEIKMKDLIERQAAIDAVFKDDRNTTIKQRLEALPSAQPQRCSDILDELKDDDYYNYIHTGHSRFSEADWDYLIYNAKEKEELHERLDIKAGGD